MPSGEKPASVTVVVPVRNGARTIRETLAGLTAQDHDGPWEIVVVDNGSTDGTAEEVTRLAAAVPTGSAPIRLVRASDHAGIAYARNVGVRAATGEFLAYCDADDVPATGWLRALVEAAREGDLVGGSVELARLNPVARRAIYSGSGMPIDELPRPFDFLAYTPAANLGVWRVALVELGGWNESYDFGGEDAELCWRAQIAGRRLVFAPDAVVHTRLRTTLSGLARQAYRDGTTMPQLYRDFGAAGMPRRSPAKAAASWLWILVASPTALIPGPRRVIWVRRAAQHWGRLVSSLRHRVLFL